MSGASGVLRAFARATGGNSVWAKRRVGFSEKCMPAARSPTTEVPATRSRTRLRAHRRRGPAAHSPRAHGRRCALTDDGGARLAGLRAYQRHPSLPPAYDERPRAHERLGCTPTLTNVAACSAAAAEAHAGPYTRGRALPTMGIHAARSRRGCALTDAAARYSTLLLPHRRCGTLADTAACLARKGAPATSSPTLLLPPRRCCCLPDAAAPSPTLWRCSRRGYARLALTDAD